MGSSSNCRLDKAVKAGGDVLAGSSQIERERKRVVHGGIMAVLDEGSSSMASSPLQFFSPKSIAMKSDERGIYLIHLLLNCANFVSSNDLERADACLAHIFLLGASPSGDTIQRLSSVFSRSLSHLLLRSSFPGIFHSISANSPPPSSSSSFFNLCPFLKLAHIVIAQSVLETMEGELLVHVIDLSAADPSPWIALLQALSSRPGGAPHLRITGVHPEKQKLDLLACKLSNEAERLNIPFQFNSIVSSLEDLEPERSLPVKSGEAIAVCSALQLHRLLRRKNKAEEFLSAIRRMNPKITVLVERELCSNGGTLMERFMETLNYYAAMFDCLESATAGRVEERERVERESFGEEVRALMAGEERRERMEKWARRMEVVGFKQAQMSYLALLQARRLLQQGYGVREERGGGYSICWQDRALFAVSAWASRRF